MNKRLLSYLIVVILAAGLAACTRPASKAPVLPAAVTTLLPFDAPAQVDPVKEAAAGTATAMAKSGGTQATAAPEGIGGEAATPTPNIVEPADAPVPSATPTAKPTKKAVTAAPVERPATYTIAYGEWPICIARRYNLDLDSFFAVNNLNMQSRVLAGAVLKIPQSGTWSTTYGPRYWHSHPATYTVRAGDNIHSIACYYGDVSPEAILEANDLSGSYTLHTGQKLDIP